LLTMYVLIKNSLRITSIDHYRTLDSQAIDYSGLYLLLKI